MRDKILVLLTEIGSVCEKENIPFFLSEEFALRVYRGQPIGDKFCDAAIMIFAQDAERLSRALLARYKARTVESLENNKDFPGFYLRYMDIQTTMLYYGDEKIFYKNNSIGIDIELICSIHNTGWKNKILNRLKEAQCQRFLAQYVRGSNVKGKYIERIFLKFFNSGMGMRKLFKLWIKQGAKVGQKVMVALNNGRQIRMNSDLFRATQKVTIAGRDYPVVKELDMLIGKLYADGSKLRPYSECIFDVLVPWQQYYKDIKSKSINLKKAQQNRRHYLRWRKKFYIPLLNKRSYYYDVVFCSGERVKLWRNYQKGKLLAVQRLYSEKKYSKLKDEMEDYLDVLRYYAKKKIGLCFNPEVLEIGIKLLIMEDVKKTRSEKAYKKKCAKWLNLVKTIPYRHFDEIQNSFMGTPVKGDILKEKKQLCYNSLLQFCDDYYMVKEKETEPI